MRTRLLLLWLILFSQVCLAGLFDQVQALLPGQTTPSATVELVDITGSVREDLLPICAHAHRTWLAGMKAGDRLAIASIDDQPASKKRFIAREVLADSGVELKDLAAQNASRARLDAAFTTLAKLDPPKQTRLFDAIAFAADALAIMPGRKVLLVASDGEEFSAIANFDSDPPRNAAEIQALIGKLSKRGLAPSLAGVDVYWVGLGGRDAARQQWFRLFWTEYFRAAGATVRQLSREGLAQK